MAFFYSSRSPLAAAALPHLDDPRLQGCAALIDPETRNRNSRAAG
jgi:hypothetical protein